MLAIAYAMAGELAHADVVVVLIDLLVLAPISLAKGWLMKDIGRV